MKNEYEGYCRLQAGEAIDEIDQIRDVFAVMIAFSDSENFHRIEYDIVLCMSMKKCFCSHIRPVESLGKRETILSRIPWY